MLQDETLEVGLAAGLDIPTAMVLSEVESGLDIPTVTVLSELGWDTEDSLLLFFTVISFILWLLKG